MERLHDRIPTPKESEIMTKRGDTDERGDARGWRRAALPALLGVAALALVGCTDGLLDVDDPDIVTPEQLQGPNAVPTAIAGVVGDFQEGFDEYMLYSSLFTDEMILGGTFMTRQRVDDRNVVEEPSNASIEADVYSEMHISRASADQRVTDFENALGDEDFAEVEGLLREGIALGKYYGAYNRMLFAELFCQSIFGGEDGEPAPLGSDARMEEAFALFGEAASAAADAGLGDVELAATVGQARAEQWLGNHGQAAQLASAVPTGFVFEAEYSNNQDAQNNEVYQLSWGDVARLRWTVGDGSVERRGFEKYAYYDEWVDQGLIVPGPDGFVPEEAGIDVAHLQMLYNGPAVSAVLASGWEARMIEAETMLRNGSFQAAEEMVNAMLADPSVNPMVAVNPSLLEERTVGGVTAPAIGAFDPVDFTGDLQGDLVELARARAAGLWLSGTRQATSRRWVEEFGRGSTADIYPVRVGDDIFFPVVESELDNNPNISSAC